MDAVDLARTVLRATSDWFPYSVDPGAVTVEEMALAGLARCRRLLSGMVRLHAEPDLTGGFARTLYEVWLGAMFLLLGGQEAYERLESNDIRSLQRQAKRIKAHLDPNESNPVGQRLMRQTETFSAAPKNTKGELDVAAMAENVTKLLVERGQPANFPNEGYAFLYGPESYVNVHGGIGAMKQHLLERGEVIPYIDAAARPHRGADHRLEVACAMVMSLADYLCVRMGLPRKKLDESLSGWLRTRRSPA